MAKRTQEQSPNAEAINPVPPIKKKKVDAKYVGTGMPSGKVEVEKASSDENGKEMGINTEKKTIYCCNCYDYTDEAKECPSCKEVLCSFCAG
jgi:hypothetical protein